jgi:hypothetical protein
MAAIAVEDLDVLRAQHGRDGPPPDETGVFGHRALPAADQPEIELGL